MEIKKIKITDIIPAEYNPRKISNTEFNKLSNSLNEFGLVDPIIINLKNNKIIGGHQRYEVLLDTYMQNNEFFAELNLLELGDVGWIFTETDLKIKSADHEKALNLALNKISGEWDTGKLTDLLEDLELNEFDISLTGFDDLEDIVIDLENDYVPEETQIEDEEPTPSNADLTEGITEDDYEAEDDLEVNVELGDLYRLGNHLLLCGDATSKDDINRLIEGVDIDMVLTDAPYGMGLDTDFSVMKSNLKFIGDKSAFGGTKYQEGKVDKFDKKFIENILDLNINETFLWGADYFTDCIPNLTDGSWIVWDKRSNEDTNINDAVSADKMFGSCFELCWSKNKHKREIARIKWAGIFGTETEFDHKRHHPTQKPIKLNAWFINKYSMENDNILDLFGGSGSTLIACEETNRNCYMMEIDPYYCQIIINRWEEFTCKKAQRIEK